jgi:hypothetical protein
MLLMWEFVIERPCTSRMSAKFDERLGRDAPQRLGRAAAEK